MTRKASFRSTLTITLAAIMVLLSVPPDRPAHADGGIVLRPPFDGVRRATAYFDHDEPSYGGGVDGYIWIYNGECVTSSYANKTGEPYPYDGHDAWDWSMPTGTNVLAAAAGTVVLSTNNWVDQPCYGHTIIIDHGNGYYTMYAHLSTRWVGVGASVTAGQTIAYSGDTSGCGWVPAHLHFGVRHGGYSTTAYAVDPFGWRGSGRDPLFDYNGQESICLWAGAPGDDISCGDIIVEDDGEGWSEYGWWGTSTNGNGYREHHTYSWDPPPTSEAYWTPALPAQGYYQVHAFVPPIGSPSRTSHAHYVIDDGTTQYDIYRDQTGTAPRWMSLGTFQFPAGSNGWIHLDDYTGEPTESRWVAADGIKFSASIVYLPHVRTTDGWVSPILIRNDSPSSASVAISYYNNSGSRISYQTTTIGGNASKTKTPPSNFEGSAVVVASQAVSVLVENRKPSTQAIAAYPGLRAGEAATILSLPLMFYNINSAGHHWYTKVCVQNPSSSTATVRVEFNPNPDGGVGSSYSYEHTIAPNGRRTFNHYTDFFGSAVVVSDQPVVAVVREYNDDGDGVEDFASAYPARLGSTTVQLPLLFKEIYSQGAYWYTNFAVQNVGTGGTSVRIVYTCEHPVCGVGNTWTRPEEWIWPNEALNFDQRYDGLPWAQFFGSAEVTSLDGQPIAVTVNQRPLSGGLTNRLGTYVGDSGGTTVHLPRLQKEVDDGDFDWSTSVAVRNAGDQDAHIALHYYNTDGTDGDPDPQTEAVHSETIPPGRMANIDQRYDAALSGLGTFDGTGVISSDQPVAVEVNRRGDGGAGTDKLCSYNGITP